MVISSLGAALSPLGGGLVCPGVTVAACPPPCSLAGSVRSLEGERRRVGQRQQHHQRALERGQ